MDEQILKRLETLEAQISRQNARDEITNLFAAYQSEFSAQVGDALVDKYWSSREDITIELGASGIYMGHRGIPTYYQKDRIPGNYTVYTLSSPCIEIAGDGLTARGLWTSVGMETESGDLGPQPPLDFEGRKLFSCVTEDGKKYRAEWIWQRFGVDFILEDGTWRIWHLHAYEIMRCPFDRDWVRYSTERFSTDGLRIDAQFKSNIPFPPGVPPENNAFLGTTFHWQYKPDALAPEFPKAPVPYVSFDETEDKF